VATPLDADRLWTSLRVAEEATQRGTALLKELAKLLVRKDAMSAAWLADRRELRAKIEAHLAAVENVSRKIGPKMPVAADGGALATVDETQALPGAARETPAVASN
jgi:hypothetical protein